MSSIVRTDTLLTFRAPKHKLPTMTPRLHHHKDQHTPEAIAERLQQGPNASYLRDFVYGAVDGAVTTFAVVSGVAGAGLSSSAIIILGLANLLADGFSMAMGNFLANSADKQLRNKAKKEEQKHIKLYPEGEREEIRQIFAEKGLKGEVLEEVVQAITSDDKRWVETMLHEEFGLPKLIPNPYLTATVTFVSFFIVGFIPIFSFVANWLSPGTFADPFFLSTILTGLAFFLIGALKSLVVKIHWLISSLETFVIGSIAAALAYGIGVLLKEVVI